jgi:ubiquinone/menaquinone biosynthesis C-methylase UbiE
MIEWRRLGAKDKASNIISLLKGRSVSSVLEVGCGTGAVLDELSRAHIGTRHVGVDLADPQKHAETALELLPYDGATLPFGNNSFDLVYASHVLEHVLEPRSFLAELHRVGKLIYVEVPCELHLRTDYTKIQSTLNIGHINSFTPHSFALMMRTSGFDVLEFSLFDHSDEVHEFQSTHWKASIKAAARRKLLKFNPSLASKIFTYHCGALCR